MPKRTQPKRRSSIVPHAPSRTAKAQVASGPGPPLDETWRAQLIIPLGTWVDVPSESDEKKVYHVYSGDLVNTPHCTCKSKQWRTDFKENELHTCKHILRTVFGRGAA